jgi:DNA-binding NarL/FixJ family response regulator
MKRLRLLIAEDHETVREGLKLILSAQTDMEVVGEAGDGLTAIERAKELLPDVVIMDVSMPKLNGLKATERLRRSCPDVKVLALTRHKDDGYLQQILSVGASGYVLKQSPSLELLHAIRAVAGGGKYLDPAVAGRVIGGFASKNSAVSGSHQQSLSDREKETLRLTAWGHSNKEIANQMGLSVKTVEVHKGNAMKKLGMQSRIEVVRYALLQGWLEET